MPLSCVGQSRTRHLRFFVKFVFRYGAFRDTFAWQFGVGRMCWCFVKGLCITLSQIELIRFITFVVLKHE
jgi:hypothetical protein